MKMSDFVYLDEAVGLYRAVLLFTNYKWLYILAFNDTESRFIFISDLRIFLTKISPNCNEGNLVNVEKAILSTT